MYTSYRTGEAQKESPIIPELEQDVTPALLSSITELSDEALLKDLLVHEKSKNTLLIHHNDRVRDENELLRIENENLKFERKNLNFVIDGLNECVLFLKERIMNHDDGLVKTIKDDDVTLEVGVLKQDAKSDTVISGRPTQSEQAEDFRNIILRHRTGLERDKKSDDTEIGAKRGSKQNNGDLPQERQSEPDSESVATVSNHASAEQTKNSLEQVTVLEESNANPTTVNDNKGCERDSDIAIEICTMAETNDILEDLQCRIQVLQSELLCKNRIIEDLVKSNEQTKSSLTVAAKMAALEEKVKGAQRENKQLYVVAKEFEKEREEWQTSKLVIKEKLSKIDQDHRKLREVALALEQENKELKRRNGWRS